MKGTIKMRMRRTWIRIVPDGIAAIINLLNCELAKKLEKKRHKCYEITDSYPAKVKWCGKNVCKSFHILRVPPKIW